MIRQYQTILGTPVLHFETGKKIAQIEDVIIDPDHGKIEGFWVKSNKSPIPYPILQTQDILEWKKNIYVKNEHVINDPAEIIRIKEILSKNRLIIGNHVQNESGKSYGRVYNLSFNDKIFYLNDIYVQKSFLGIVNYQKRIFASTNIIEILEKTILIKDDNKEEVKSIPVLFKKDVADASS